MVWLLRGTYRWYFRVLFLLGGSGNGVEGAVEMDKTLEKVSATGGVNECPGWLQDCFVLDDGECLKCCWSCAPSAMWTIVHYSPVLWTNFGCKMFIQLPQETQFLTSCVAIILIQLVHLSF